jgi:NADPH2:quinone reductase
MNTKMMMALRFEAFGPPSVLRIEEAPIPEPGEGEVLVHVKAASINPSDVANVSGRFKHTTLPRTPGRDFAGIVVKGKKLEGKEVWGSSPNLGIDRDGSHAEYVTVAVEAVSPKPKPLSMEQAATIGVPYITAWASVVSALEIQAGETILIVGAASAVGQAGTQIANWKGARVISADLKSDSRYRGGRKYQDRRSSGKGDATDGGKGSRCGIRYRRWFRVRTGIAIAWLQGTTDKYRQQGRFARQFQPHRLLP